MLLPDVNLLIYAHRADTPQHEAALGWFDDLLARDVVFGISSLAAVAFVRVVTGAAFKERASSLSQATEFIDELSGAPACRWVSPGLEHWSYVSRLCLATRSAGAMVGDAQHAAIAIENGCTLVSADDDFARFEPLGLRWQRWKPRPPVRSRRG